MPELKPAEPRDQTLTDLVIAPTATPVQPSHRSPARKEALVERASTEQRLVFVLEERVADLELRLREQAEAAHLRELEMRSLESDLALKEHYVSRLEQEHAQIMAARDALAAEVGGIRSDLTETEHQLAEVGALAAAIQNQLAYKLSVRGVAALKQTGPLYRLLRSGARLVRGR